MDVKYSPSQDFVAKTMQRIQAYEESRTFFLRRPGFYEALQRYIVAFGGALLGVLQATHAF